MSELDFLDDLDWVDDPEIDAAASQNHTASRGATAEQTLSSDHLSETAPRNNGGSYQEIVPQQFAEATPQTMSPPPQQMVSPPPATEPAYHQGAGRPPADSFQAEPVMASAPAIHSHAGHMTSYTENSMQGGSRAMPAVSILAFCERPDSLASVQQAAADRRMQKCSIAASAGGISAAIDYLTTNQSPDLLIVESAAPPENLLASLSALADNCDPHVKVVVIGIANDVALYREIISRGVGEYLVPPINPSQLVTCFSGLFADPDDPFMGKVTGFYGVKGGVGASTLAHNLAWVMAERFAQKTGLVDLDMPFGTAALDYNREDARPISEALFGHDEIDQTMLSKLGVDISPNLNLYASPCSLDSKFDLSDANVTGFVEQIRSLHPQIILDIPSGWSRSTAQTIASIDDVVLVGAPDLTSLRNMRAVMNAIATVRMNDPLPKIILNMANLPKRPEIPVKDFEQSLGARVDCIVPFEGQLFGEAANNGQMIGELYPDSEVEDIFEDLVSMFLGQAAEVAPKKSLGGLFSRFRGRAA